MAMFINGVNRALDSRESAGQAAAKLGQQLTTGKKIQSPEDDPATWLEASRADSTSTYLDVVHTGLSEVATDLAEVDTNMHAIGQYLGTMQGQLQEALNLPAGDTQRQQLIANYNRVFQQINDTVSTASDTGARDLMSGANIQALVGANGTTKTVHGQELDTGPGGLNMGTLNPATATDDDLHAALANLTTAQSTLASRQMALGADTADIQQYATESTQVSSLYQTQSDSLTSADATEAALMLQSVQVQSSLALQTLSSISTDRSAVLALLQ